MGGPWGRGVALTTGEWERVSALLVPRSVPGVPDVGVQGIRALAPAQIVEGVLGNARQVGSELVGVVGAVDILVVGGSSVFD